MPGTHGPALRALREPAFRRLWTASVLVAFSTWMERVAIGWLVLDATGSVFLAALSFALRKAPNLLLGLLAGAMADRVERRRLLMAVYLGRAAVFVGIGGVVAGELRSIWPLLLLVVLSASTHTFEMPATQALIGDIVGLRQAASAVGLHALGVRSVGLLGALSAGLLLESVGPAPLFFGGALFLAVATAVVRSVRSVGRGSRVARRSVLRDALDGVRTMARIPVVAMLLGLTLVVEIFAFSYQSLLPAVAKDVLLVGAAGLGTLTLAIGVGSIGGSAAVTMLGHRRRRGALLLGITFVYGALLLAFAATDRFALALVVGAGLGAMAAMFDALQWVLLQVHVPDQMRGRVLGGWMWAIGFGWIGPIALGGIAQMAGVPWALATGGSAVVVLALAVAVAVPALRRA